MGVALDMNGVIMSHVDFDDDGIGDIGMRVYGEVSAWTHEIVIGRSKNALNRLEVNETEPTSNIIGTHHSNRCKSPVAESIIRSKPVTSAGHGYYKQKCNTMV